MNEYELKRRHSELMNKDDLGKELLAKKELLANPDFAWNTIDFTSKLGKRCRRCYTFFMNDILSGVDTNNSDYFEKRLCKSCFTLYSNKMERLK
jgi:hypothetical protein